MVNSRDTAGNAEEDEEEEEEEEEEKEHDWTHAGLGVLYACVLYFCICTCSAQLSMFHMERCPRNTLIIIIIIDL